ncbi:MAG: SDR family oxidoreductase, partial [Acidimicrobiia bacterium]|nr:SDR family oxidoreductase [Acidimicrobiia bacterium]
IGRADTAVTGLVNAAGIGGEPGDVTMTPPQQWRRTIEVNLTGAFLVSRSAIPLLRAAGGGSIVHISSQLGLVGAKGSPAYGASKAGLIGLGRSMALDHAADGIRVNTVCPGPLDTPMFQASSGPENLEYLTEDRIPVGRIGRPEEVAALVEFLLGDESGFMTGAAIPIDGGWTAR